MMAGKEIQEQLQYVREQLDAADRDHIKERQIGRILVSLSKLADLIEATNERVDGAYEYAGLISR
jgi:hypothetical protein